MINIKAVWPKKLSAILMILAVSFVGIAIDVDTVRVGSFGVIRLELNKVHGSPSITSLGAVANNKDANNPSKTETLSAGDFIVGVFAGDSPATAFTWGASPTQYGDLDSSASNAGNAESSIWTMRILEGGTHTLSVGNGNVEAKCAAYYKLTEVNYPISIPNQTNTNTAWSLYSGSYIRTAASFYFTPCTITSVDVKLAKYGSPTGTAYVRIRNYSSDSIIGTLGSIDVSTLTTTQTFYTFNSDSVVISSDTAAFLTVEYNDGSTSHNIRVSYYSIDNTIPGTNFAYYQSSWTSTTSELCWQNFTGAKYASPLDKYPSNTGSGTDASTGSTGTLTEDDEIIIGASAVEDEVDDSHGTWTSGTGYISGNEQFEATNGGGDASNMQVHSVAKIVTDGTSQAYQGVDAGHDSNDWASCAATYKVYAAATVDISNTPSTWILGTIQENTTYWANGSEPSWPLDDGDCEFAVTNNSGATVDITIQGEDFTGGVGWTISTSAGEDIVVLGAGVSGDANKAAFVKLTSSPQSFISNLADSATEYWEMYIDTGTFTDGELKSATVTITGSLS